MPSKPAISETVDGFLGKSHVDGSYEIICTLIPSVGCSDTPSSFAEVLFRGGTTGTDHAISLMTSALTSLRPYPAGPPTRGYGGTITRPGDRAALSFTFTATVIAISRVTTLPPSTSARRPPGHQLQSPLMAASPQSCLKTKKSGSSPRGT